MHSGSSRARAFGSGGTQKPAQSTGQVGQAGRMANVNTNPIDWDDTVLPALARNKFADIVTAASEAHTVAQSLSPEIDELRLQKVSHERRIKELTEPAYGSATDPSDPIITQENAKLKKISEKLDRLEQRRSELLRRWQPAKRDETVCERFLRRAAGRLTVYTGSAPKLLKGETELVAWERSGRRCAEIIDNIRRTRAAPIPSAVAKAKADATVAALAERGRPDVLGLIDHNEDIRFSTIGLTIEHTFDDRTRGSVTVPDVLGLFARALPDVLKAMLHQEIDQRSNDEIALTDEERSCRIAAGLDDLLAVGREEEHWFMQAAAKGANIQRRDGSDPRAILGVVSPVEPDDE